MTPTDLFETWQSEVNVKNIAKVAWHLSIPFWCWFSFFRAEVLAHEGSMLHYHLNHPWWGSSLSRCWVPSKAGSENIAREVALGWAFEKGWKTINPFPPSVPIWHRLSKLLILILEGIIKKISYERRDYESVDEKSLS